MDGMYTLLPPAPRLLPGAIQQNPLKKVLSCKPEIGSRIVGKPSRSGRYEHMYPPTGYARHQPMGLASDPNKPMDLPLMPLASSFYAALPNTLGQPPG